MRRGGVFTFGDMAYLGFADGFRSQEMPEGMNRGDIAVDRSPPYRSDRSAIRAVWISQRRVRCMVLRAGRYWVGRDFFSGQLITWGLGIIVVAFVFAAFRLRARNEITLPTC